MLKGLGEYIFNAISRFKGFIYFEKIEKGEAYTVAKILAVDSSNKLGVINGIEGTDIKSTGEAGGSKFLREDGDGTCSWQTVSGGGSGISHDGSTANGVLT